MKKFRCILRYCIDPGFHEEERIRELTDFCRKSGIDEVMLFFNAEELNTGHWQPDDMRRWLPLAKKIKQALAEIRVDLSLNPWTTLVHEARGRKLRPEQHYTLMVGDTGSANGVTVCPLDENWLRDLCEVWQLAVRELAPVAVWLEDDFRYHNHGEIMGFGGCYCDRHLTEFSRLVGRTVSREELLACIFAPGEAHPWRKIWLRMNGQIMNAAGRRIAAAVAEISPGTRIGLMAGFFDSMAADGRDLGELQQCLQPVLPMAFRPTMSPYTEVWAMRRAPVQARMTISLLTRPFLLYPELESGPRHGAYSLGCGFAGWEIMESAAFGSDGITMNCFDMMGNGTVMDRRFGAMLAEIRPRLDAVAALEIDDTRAVGAQVLISPDIAMCAPAEGKMYQAFSGEWGRVATILGISHRFVHRIEPTGAPYLVSGSVLRAFSREEVETLLAGPVVLDATAAAEVIAMGLGNLIGSDGAVRYPTTENDCSYEEIAEDDPAVYGVALPRLTVQRAAWEVTAFRTQNASNVLSWVCSSAHRKLFPGAFRFDNERGGKVVTLAFDMGDRGREEWFYFGFFSVFRRIFLQRILRELAPHAPGAYVNGPARCFCSVLPDGKRFVALLNSTTDPLPGLEVLLTGEAAFRRVERLEKDGSWSGEGFQVKRTSAGTAIRLRRALPIHGAEFLRLTEKQGD
ncbi:MAG: hypothetical protein MR051_00660 [Lentisphaeria bacterium]|nr:hypothetical protein [Lentisphaeria bacterium]